jgi:hypothetical protein
MTRYDRLRQAKQLMRHTCVLCECAETLMARVWEMISDSQIRLSQTEQRLASGRALCQRTKALLNASAPSHPAEGGF